MKNYKTYKQYQAYASEVFGHKPELIKGFMAIEFVCDVAGYDRECLEFALKGDARYQEKFFHRLNQELKDNPDKELFAKLLQEELGIIS